MSATSIFLAAPLFSEAERRFNAAIADSLRGQGFSVWLAQDAPFIQGGSIEEKRAIFDGDVAALRASDIVVAILDGPHVEEGVAFEVGLAHAFAKTVVALKTDYRTFSSLEPVNLLLEVPLRRICPSLDALVDELRRIVGTSP